MIKTKIKRKYYILINILLIFFLWFLLFKTYSDALSTKINKISYEKFESIINNRLNNLSKIIINENVIDDILKIYTNKNDEILYADYDLKKSYILLDSIKDKITKEFNEDFIIEFPFLIESNNILLSNLGPKIQLSIKYVNSMLGSIQTKVTNYGLNNALIEEYIKIKVDGLIITPINEDKISITYDMLISSKVINGRVPDYIGRGMSSSGEIFNIPFID